MRIIRGSRLRWYLSGAVHWEIAGFVTYIYMYIYVCNFAARISFPKLGPHSQRCTGKRKLTYIYTYIDICIYMYV